MGEYRMVLLFWRICLHKGGSLQTNSFSWIFAQMMSIHICQKMVYLCPRMLM
uniref:Uncharacterized protein n=1 Tax=Brassica oleracea TaxID=3712 RepID=A0A3P6CCS6_BRAOL|nr:unnamed protein product [Brassica oleracea]